MNRISIRSVAFSLSAAVAVVVASIVAADSQVLPLGSEALHSSNFSSSGTPGQTLDLSTTCDSSKQNGTVNYSVTGDATGPFTGTYSESGYFKLVNGVVTELSANFSITPAGGGSGVTGTKTLGGPANSAKGSCSSTGGTSTQRAGVMSGIFNYTANAGGSNTSGTGDMALDITETSSNPTGSGFAQSNFHGSNPAVGNAKATGGGSIYSSPGDPGVTFGFNAQVQNNGSLHGRGTVFDHNTNTRIKILNVATMVVADRVAIFTGQCELNGAPNSYTAEVSDIDEPGIGVDTFGIQCGSYSTGPSTLTGGNIQVRGIAGGVGTPTPSITPTATPPPD